MERENTDIINGNTYEDKDEHLFDIKGVVHTKDDTRPIIQALKKQDYGSNENTYGLSRVSGKARTSTPVGYRCSAKCRPEVARGHNIRDKNWIDKRTHIDSDGLSKTYLDMGTLEQCYEKIFGEALEEYNKNQKRKDRQINNYLTKILEDKRRGSMKSKTSVDNSRKPVYEFIFQVGKRDRKVDKQKSIEVLEKFTLEWIPQHYPNLIPVGIYLHADEYTLDPVSKRRLDGSVHMHFDFIPVAHALTKEERQEELCWRTELEIQKKKECEEKGIVYDKKAFDSQDWEMMRAQKFGKALRDGMKLQSSLSGACCEMGFRTKGKLTAQIQMEEAIRTDLLDMAESFGIEVNRDIEINRDETVSIDEYKVREDNKKILEGIESTRNYNIIREQQLKAKNDELEKKKKTYELIISTVNTAEQIKLDYKKYAEEIREAVSHPGNATGPLVERSVTRFTELCEKVVYKFRTAINCYDKYLKGKTSREIREVCDDMDRKGVTVFEEYLEKKTIEQKPASEIIRKKKIDMDIEWDR